VHGAAPGGRRPGAELARRVEAESGIGREEGIERSARRHDPIDAAHEGPQAPRPGDRRMEQRVEGGGPGDREHGQDVHEPPPAPAPRGPVGDEARHGARDREQDQHRSGPPRGYLEGGGAHGVRGPEPAPQGRTRIEPDGQRCGEGGEQDEGGRVEAGAAAGGAYGSALGGRSDHAGTDQERDGGIEREEVHAPLGRREPEEDEPRAHPGLGEVGCRRPLPAERHDAEREERRPRQESDEREREEVAGAVRVARVRVRIEIAEPVLTGDGGEECGPLAAERRRVPGAGHQQGHAERGRSAEPAR